MSKKNTKNSGTSNKKKNIKKGNVKTEPKNVKNKKVRVPDNDEVYKKENVKQNIKQNSKKSNKNKDKVIKEKQDNIKRFPVEKDVEKKIKKEKKKVNKKRRTVIVCIFLFIGIIVAFIYLALTLNTFSLKNIVVSGNSKYTSNEIIYKSNYKMDENIFIQYLKYKDDDFKELPYISKVKVKIVLPDEICLDVIERSSKYIAFDKEKNKFFRLDNEGYILEEVEKKDKQDEEMIVYGITFDDEIVFGSKINEIDLDKLAVYEKIAEEYKKSKIVGDITQVNFENSLTTITLNDKLNVILPNDTNIEYNLDLLNSILKRNGDLQGVIDMTKENPVYSIY